MANTNKDIWLKVLIGFIVTVLGLTVTLGVKGIGKLDDNKLDKEVFKQHETYQNQQYGEIKDTLVRIEEKL